MALSGSRDYPVGNRSEIRYRWRPKRVNEGTVPKEQCWRVLHGVRCAVLWEAPLVGHIERHLQAIFDPRSSAAALLNSRVGDLEKARFVASVPAWQVGEYGFRLIRRLTGLPGRAGAVPGLTLELSYAYLDGLLSVNEWVRVMRLIEKLGQPLVADGIEQELARTRCIQPDRPILLPVSIGAETEIFRLDPTLYRHAALLVDDWCRGSNAAASAPLRRVTPDPR